MPTSKTVSVCLPTLNGEPYLPSAIESVLAQTYSDLELIVIDDHSSDRSVAVIEQYARQDSRVKLFKNKSTLGIFKNYNACFAKSEGYYLKPFAHDDILDRNCLQVLVNALESHPNASLASGARLLIDKTGADVHAERAFESTGIVAGDELFEDFFTTFFNRVGTPSQVMFRRTDVGDGFDTVYHLSGDVDFWLSLLIKGDLYYIEEVVCKVRRHPGSATAVSTKDLSFMADSFLLTEKFADHLKKKGKFSSAIHKKMINGLVRKLRNAGSDKGTLVEPTAHIGINGHNGSRTLDYQSVAQQLLLYAADLKDELEALNRATIQQSAEYEKQIEDWETRAKDLSRELESIKNSKAWKLTEPLRKLRTVTSR